MASDDLLGIVDRSQVNARVPAQQQLQIGLELRGESRRQRFAAQEGLQQFSDTSGIHGCQHSAREGARAGRITIRNPGYRRKARREPGHPAAQFNSYDTD
jgi:hypothetical protein